ncbi:MAG: SDR family oxidoreductase [Planctomycetes bacterium]|nr:SDR family oxidoreductase [Planctomycetota bacterium]
MDKLKGLRALVGGASSGIGRAIALALREEGAEVWGLARSAEKLDALNLAGSVVHDLEDLDGLQKALEVLPQMEHGPAVDILVHNTGGPPGGPILQADVHEFGRAFRRHVMAGHLLVQACVPHMESNGYGRILNVVSTSVREPIPNLGVSNTVRGAVASWSKTLSKELPPGVTINNLLPGFTDTDRLASLKEANAQRQGVDAAAVEGAWLASIPEGRLGRPEELAGLAVFLASEAGGYVRGQSIAVDGGRLSSI